MSPNQDLSRNCTRKLGEFAARAEEGRAQVLFYNTGEDSTWGTRPNSGNRCSILGSVMSLLCALGQVTSLSEPQFPHFIKPSGGSPSLWLLKSL